MQLIPEPSDEKAVYWFWLFRLDTGLLKVDKPAFAEALSAEGMPVTTSYLPVPTRDNWCRHHTVFGTSGYPWASPLYDSNRESTYELPNIMATDECHFRVSFHEDWTNQEVDDLIAALSKVEQAYRNHRN